MNTPRTEIRSGTQQTPALAQAAKAWVAHQDLAATALEARAGNLLELPETARPADSCIGSDSRPAAENEGRRAAYQAPVLRHFFAANTAVNHVGAANLQPDLQLHAALGARW